MYTASPPIRLDSKRIGQKVRIEFDQRELIVGQTKQGLINLHYKGYLAVQAVPSTKCVVIVQ